MWLIRVTCVLSLTVACAAQDGALPTSAAPAVTTTEPPKPLLQLVSSWLDVFPSEKVEFRCDVAGSSDWTFIWKRNDEPVQESDPNVALSADHSHLTITANNQIYAGSYSCQGRHKTNGISTANSNSFQLTVYPNKPRPDVNKTPNFDTMYPGESVTFTCTVQESSGWEYLWFHNGKEIQRSASYTINPIAHANQGVYYCQAKRGNAPFYSEKSSEISLQVPSNKPSPDVNKTPNFDTMYPGESVTFTCTVQESSGWEYLWFHNGKEIQRSASYTINPIAHANQGVYYCQAKRGNAPFYSEKSSELSLQVPSNKPRPDVNKTPNFDTMYPGESVTFTCKVQESSGWEYLWFHNGKEIQRSASYQINAIAHANQGAYHCQAKRGNAPFYSEKSSELTLQVSDPPTPTMKLLTSWLDVFEEEIVAFSCEVGLSDWTFIWYQNKTKIEDDSFVIDDEGTLLNITSASKDHEGVYACQANLETRRVKSGLSNTATVSVYDERPTPTLHKVPGFNPMYVGETVSMTCNVDVSTGWGYQWSKDGNDLPFTNKTIKIRLSPSDGGLYACSATRADTMLPSSNEMQLLVHEIPVPSLKQVTSWLDVFPGEWVQLQCGMDSGSGWTYTWSRGGQEVKADVVVSLKKEGADLSIESASAAHAGLYTCKGHLRDRSVSSKSSEGRHLTVYDKKPSVTLTQDPDYKVMFLEESVSFTCHINVSSGWEYEWYKDGNKIAGPGKIINYSPLSKDKDGKYSCRTRRGTVKVFYSENSQTMHLQVKEKKPKPLMTQQPNVEKVYVGESVSFECKVELSSGWRFQWYKDGEPLLINSSRLTFDASLSSSGNYKCRGTREKTRSQTEYSDGRTLRVFEIPVPVTKGETPWLDVFPAESVKLSCWMDGTSDWKYTWFRNNKKVPDGGSFKFSEEILSIKSASASHQGQYSCSGELKSRPVISNNSSGITLSVYATEPKVTLTQTPKFDKMYTGDQVSFSCHVNVSSGWKYHWYKNNRGLRQSTDNHTITSSVTSDTGSYRCEVKRGEGEVFTSKSEPLAIHISERPQANIILLTGWSEVFSTDSLMLQCSVQGSISSEWNYTWFREGKQILTSTSEKYSVTPSEDPEQSQYKCQGIRDQLRPTYSKHSEEFTTKNLLLKRRMLLSIAGCIVFGIVAVFLGFTAYKIFCKPAEDEDRPEEVDLFVPMVQQKGTDIPCPLVEYITDATLNAPSKDVNENGAICSETTPLPITQEDQAVPTESSDAAKENGGLASFKQ